MLPNNTMTTKRSHHILPINPLSQIITKNNFPIYSVKHSNNQKVLSKSKTIFPFQTHSNMRYKKTKPKIQNLKTQLHNINKSNLILKNLSKHNTNPNKHYAIIIHNIIFDEKTHYVSLFKDFLYVDDDGEFLKRFYFKHEQKQKLKQILTYYFTVYNVNELYSINFLSYFNTIVMLRHYFKHFKLANRFNNNNNKLQKESDKQYVGNNNKNNANKYSKQCNDNNVLKHIKLLSHSMTLTKVNLLPVELIEGTHYGINDNKNKVTTPTTQENTNLPTNSIHLSLTRNNSFSTISNERTIESLIRNLEPIHTKEESYKRMTKSTHVTKAMCSSKQKSSSSSNKNINNINKHKRATPLDQCLVFPESNNYNRHNLANGKTKVVAQKIVPIYKKGNNSKQKLLNSPSKNICLTERTCHKNDNDYIGVKNSMLFQKILAFPLRQSGNKVSYERTLTGRSFKSGNNSLSKMRVCNTTRNNNKSNNKEIKKTKNLKLMSSLKTIKK